MKQYLLAMTKNIAGLSAHSCIAMDKYINDNNIKIFTISESHRKFQGFGNYDTYRAHSNKLGCSLLIHKKLNSYEVKITPRKHVDCCSAAISFEKKKFLLGSRYVHLGNTENIESATDVLTEVYTLCKNESSGIGIRGIHYGAEKLENKFGKILADYCVDNSLSLISPHQTTFDSASKKRSSIIDFCITEQKCSDLVCNARVIEDIEFFSGAPEQGHWPVLFDIDIPVKYDNPKRRVLNYKMANWGKISIQLENIMVENMDSMITEAHTKAFLIFMGLVRGVCENSIPRKTLCKSSKPFWNNKLTHLSKKLKDARKKYRLQCNPKTRTM